VRILIAAATDLEVAPIVERLDAAPMRQPGFNSYTHRAHDIDVLTTGVGMVATAAWCSRALTRTPYHLALNFGVCGSFDARLQPAMVVHVVSDRLAELGAEDGDAFLTLEELRLSGQSCFSNASPPANPELARLPAVTGVTVNTVHGNERTIAAVSERFRPQVESMEGAAFMYSCLIAGVPFAQVRAISNVVERRNRAAWKLPAAIESLGRTAHQILETV
jgi:futalosine hydrolase